MFTNTDTAAPGNPSIWSPTHPTGWLIRDDTIVVQWAGAWDNISGVNGYSFELDTNALTIPDTIVDVVHGSAASYEETYPSLGDTTYYFHLRTRDNEGLWSDAAHLGPLVVDSSVDPLPIGGPAALGMLAAAITLAGVRALRRRR